MQEASDRGYFIKDGTCNVEAILWVARDVASGMAFLHERGVAHGDLTGGNVLLASNPASPAKVTAKIADFGLARALDVKSKIETRTYGTVTHMPPELLVQGIFSKVPFSSLLLSCRFATRWDRRGNAPWAGMRLRVCQLLLQAADAFSLGVLLWEMFHGVRAWSSMNHAQIITAVAVNHRSLEFSTSVPEACANLALELMSSDPAKRPTLAQAVERIDSLLAALSANP